MSYVSLLKNIPDFLSQPTGIAAIASIGIHGTIAFILPLMPIDSKPKQQEINSSKTVGLVELNQAEQNRLPQAGGAQVPSIKPLALQPQIPPPPPGLSAQQQLLPTIPQPPATQVILPPLPKSSANLAIPSLPKSQPLQRLPLNNYPINPVGSSLNTTAVTPPQPVSRYNDKVALGTPQSLPPSNIGELQPAKTPAELPQTNLPLPAQSVNTTSTSGNIATQLPQTNLPVQSVNTFTKQSSIASGIPSGRLPELQAAKIPPDLRTIPSVASSGTAPSTTIPVVAKVGTVPTGVQNQQIITPLGQASQTRVSLGDSNPLSSPLGRIAPLSRQTRYPSNPGGSVVGKTSTFGDQFNQAKKQYPNIETKLPIFGTINAKSSQQSRVDGALIVDAEGKVESVAFMNSAVSSDLQASTREYFREYFQNNPVQKTGRPKYYPFSLSLRTDSNSDAVKQAPVRLLPVAQPTSNGGSLSTINQKQETLSQLRQKLIERRRGLSPVAQPSNEQPANNLSQQSHTSHVNGQTLQPREVSRISPQTSVKPLPNQGVKANQATPPSQITPQAPSQPKVSSNQPSTSIESGQKLLRRLRELREQRQDKE